jgi:hypothetical protein
VEYLMEARGQSGMNELLQALGETRSLDQAFRQVHGEDAAGVHRAWREYLELH